MVIAACVAAPAAAQAGLTTFIAKRPGLLIRIKVRRHQIVFTELGAFVICKRLGPEAGSINLNEWDNEFGVRHFGRFRKSEFESYEGSGFYFWRLEGKVRHNRIVGRYTAWEERLGEEEWLPRCGTRSPKGLPMRFVAHRVSGPRWHP